MKKPEISVVMSCYNSEKHLKEAVESILQQTFTDFEFIIWNDGSTDTTDTILRGYADPRIKYFCADNQGLGKALHDACEKATGKYIARMDDDDIAMPDRLGTEYAFLESHPEYVLVSSSVNYIDVDGNSIGYSSPPLSDYVIKKTLSIVHPAVMFRTSVYKLTPGYLNLRTAQDHVLWSFFSQYGKFRNLPKQLLKYRIQPNSVGRKQRIPELTQCCQLIRCRIIDEGTNGHINETLINLHNEIFLLNTELSRDIPAAQTQQNSIHKKICNILGTVWDEANVAKALCWPLTVYKTIKCVFK